MKPTPTSAQPSNVTRRTFLKNGAILTTGIAALSPLARAQTNKSSKLHIFHVGTGGSIAKSASRERARVVRRHAVEQKKGTQTAMDNIWIASSRGHAIYLQIMQTH